MLGVLRKQGLLPRHPVVDIILLGIYLFVDSVVLLGSSST